MENLTITRKSLAAASGPICDQHSAMVLEELIRIRALQAYGKQGERAFDCPKKTAAIHEAGHAVIHSALGESPQKCMIEQKAVTTPNGGCRNVWLGVTTITNKTRLLSGETTTADQDINLACSTIAGLAAEMIFDPDCREGSSLDEIALCQLLCANAAKKLKISAEDLFYFVQRRTMNSLDMNSPAHAAVVGALMRGDVLRTRMLRFLLKEVTPMQPLSSCVSVYVSVA